MRRLPALVCIVAALGVVGLAQAAPDSRTILVKVSAGSEPSQRAAISRRLGARSVRALPAGWRAYTVAGGLSDAAAARAVSGLPAEAVEPDQRVQLMGVPNDRYVPLQLHLSRIGAFQAWDLAPARQDVVVAVVDTGVALGHEDLDGRLWVNPVEAAGVPGRDDDHNGVVDDINGADLVGGARDGRRAGSVPPSLDTAHGTHVAGLVAAREGNLLGIAGVAPNARIMDVRSVSGTNGGSLADAIEGIKYAQDAGADIINMSWGLAPGNGSQALCDAVEAAGSTGIIMVAAAGNDDGRDLDAQPIDPASCPAPDLITVAATDASTDTLAGFSNVGAYTVDLGAPGTQQPFGQAPPGWTGVPPSFTGLLSLYPAVTGYAAMEGTSMAAPVVAGAAALLRGAHPELSAEEIGALLRTTGAPLSDLAGTTLSGRRLDVRAALLAAASVAPASVPPVGVALAEPVDDAITGARPRFSWVQAAGGDPVEYRVLVDGVSVASVPGAQRTATPAVDLRDGRHAWWVEGTAGRATRQRRTVLVDATPPAPLALVARASSAWLAVSWSPATDATSGVAQIRVERNGRVVARLAPEATSHTMPDAIVAGVTETVAVVAEDRAGNTRRGEVAVTGVASPTPPPTPLPPPAPAAQSGARSLSVAPASYARRYEVRAKVAGAWRVIARGRIAARRRSLTVRVPATLATSAPLSLRTARMGSTARLRTVRVRPSRTPRRYVIEAHDLSLRRTVARGRLAAGRARIRVSLPRAFAARGPRLSVVLRPTP